jgi:arginine/lysine/ornithine decarboxylase
MKSRAPLLEEVLKYHREENLILSMPGNKSGIGFLRDSIGKEFVNNLGFLDITEVEPLDNLHCPEGVIKEAQELLANTYGVKEAFFVVNGSTAGNLASIFDAFDEGDEVLVERNCHKSIYNGLILRKLKITYIEAVIDEEKDIVLPPNRENIYKALTKCQNPKGIILTYPNYFGISYDIDDVLMSLKETGLKIIIDGAHGAHFGVNERLPKPIWNIADYIVISAHKTLPSLTQGSYLLVNSHKNVDFYLKAFMTTSPSYLIMSSLDYGRYYLDNYGEEDYEKLISIAEEWKGKINSLKKVSILSKNDLCDGYNLDLSRYLMLLPKGYSGHKLLEYLRKKKIQAEMSTSVAVVLILSPFNTSEDFETIYKAIEELHMDSLKQEVISKYYSVIAKKVYQPYEVFQKSFENITLDYCIGRIAKESIIPYPPGIPLICAGEVISTEAIKIVRDYIINGRTVMGVSNNLMVKVIKE